jgi:CheY-like chemotaxis protein
MLTTLARRAEDHEARREFAAVVTKPIKASQLYDAVATAVGAPIASEQPARTPQHDRPVAARAQLRILLAEDNEVNRRLALRLLDKLGYKSEVVVNGLEALAELRPRTYDIVLTDVEMPEMDGLEAARRIHREWTAAERPRIIAMMANAMQGDHEACLAAGMDDDVSKPVDLEALAQVLSRCARRAVLDPKALERLGTIPADREFTAELGMRSCARRPPCSTRSEAPMSRGRRTRLRPTRGRSGRRNWPSSVPSSRRSQTRTASRTGPSC